MKKLKKLLSLLVFSIIGGLLGALGGTDGVSKGVRRIGISLSITLIALFTLHNWWVLTIMSMAGVLSIGYGMPDITDSGSTLGQFWARVFPYHVLLKTPKDLILRLRADILTRATIGTLICLSMLSVPILKGNWIVYGVCSLGIVISYATLSWRDLGTFKFKNKQLLWSEFVPFSIIAVLAQVIIRY